MYLYNEILLNNKKEESRDMCNNVDESLTTILNETSRTKYIYNICLHVYEIQEKVKQFYSVRKQISGCLGLEVEGLARKGHRECSEVTEIFYSLTVVGVTCAYTFVKIHTLFT